MIFELYFNVRINVYAIYSGIFHYHGFIFFERILGVFNNFVCNTRVPNKYIVDTIVIQTCLQFREEFLLDFSAVLVFHGLHVGHRIYSISGVREIPVEFSWKNGWNTFF